MAGEFNPSGSIRSYRNQLPVLGEGVFVDAAAVVIGDVVLGDDVGIWPQCAVRGDVNSIRVGARTNVQDGAILHCSRRSPKVPEGHPLTVGDDVSVGHGAILHGCHLANRIIVGMGAIVMDAACVDSDVIIAAGSLVTPGKHLESGWLYAGSPARPMRMLSDEDLELILENSRSYVGLKDEQLVAAN